MAKVRAEDQTLERIKHWAIGENKEGKHELSKKDQELFDRWDEIDNLLRAYPVKKHVVELVKKKFGGSTATAYRDIDLSKRLFNSVHRSEKEFMKRWLVDDIMLLISKSQGSPAKLIGSETQKAIDPDFRAWNSAHGNLIKLLGFDRNQNELIDPSIFEQHNYYTVININGQAMKVQEDEFLNLPIAKKNDLIDGMYELISEDIAFEMIEDNGTNSPEE